jgi:hypothetical protein
MASRWNRNSPICAREVVGRSLKELEAAGAIEMRQGRAVVLNLERLRLLTSE